MVKQIEIHGLRVHNLKNIDMELPLEKIVGICGVSGSGKSSLALGALYAEGSRRYLESLSTYTRRRRPRRREPMWIRCFTFLRPWPPISGLVFRMFAAPSARERRS